MFLFGKKDYFKPGPDGSAPVIVFMNKSITVPVYEVPAVVGRVQGQADVAINDATVSRKHFYISTYENKFTVTDQGSTSGTVINGEVLEPGVPYYLSEGDKVKIGKLDFVCHINKDRSGKKLKIPKVFEKDNAGDTSEMSKADIAAAAAEADQAEASSAAELVNGAAADVVQDAEAAAGVVQDAEAAAEVVKEAETAYEEKAEPASEPVIKLMSDPVLEEETADEEADQRGFDEEPTEEPAEDQHEDPVTELEEMGLEFGDDVSEEQEPEPEDRPGSVPEEDIRISGAEAPESTQEKAASADIEEPSTIDVMRSEKVRVNGPKFVYYSGRTAVETFTITATPFVLGRAKCDYTPGAAGVSRRHCFIDKTGSTYYITDLESTNGVWINGRRIKPYNRTALVNGDIIGIGDRVYKYEQN